MFLYLWCLVFLFCQISKFITCCFSFLTLDMWEFHYLFLYCRNFHVLNIYLLVTLVGVMFNIQNFLSGRSNVIECWLSGLPFYHFYEINFEMEIFLRAKKKTFQSGRYSVSEVALDIYRVIHFNFQYLRSRKSVSILPQTSIQRQNISSPVFYITVI